MKWRFDAYDVVRFCFWIMFLDYVSGLCFWIIFPGLCVPDCVFWIMFLDYVSGLFAFLFLHKPLYHTPLKSHVFSTESLSRNQNTPKCALAPDVPSILLQVHVHIANDPNQDVQSTGIQLDVHCRFPLPASVAVCFNSKCFVSFRAKSLSIA